MAQFRLLHITDLHISICPDDAPGSAVLWMAMQSVFPSRARPPLLRAVAQLVRSLRPEVDVIVLSGDLADDGQLDNLEAARAFIEEPAVDGTAATVDDLPTLADPDEPQESLFVLPGNHDRFRGDMRAPGGTLFDDVFSSYWNKGLGGVRCTTVFKSDACLSLIAADFCLRETPISPLKIWGQGSVRDETMERLIGETEAIRRENPQGLIVWVLHFPPLPDVESNLRLQFAEKVLIAARKMEIRYILAGHLHRDQENRYEGGLQVFSTGSAASDMKEVYGNSIQLFEFEVNEGRASLSRAFYRYDPRENMFMKEQN